ncbi:hypothetical protein LIER_18993 [Lithospermum erythrorhizon]|uniref:Uncharacterized protein n=1 Tax=Lithospermum erythrorhizon TaxID=34254 RepID=A0AAV3QLH0_LITER
MGSVTLMLNMSGIAFGSLLVDKPLLNGRAIKELRSEMIKAGSFQSTGSPGRPSPSAVDSRQPHLARQL